MWDSKKIAYDKRKELRRAFFAYGVIAIIFAVILAIGSVFIHNEVRTENLIGVDVTVSAVERAKNGALSINALDSDKVYTINNDEAKDSGVFEKLEIGETYRFYITAAQKGNKERRLYEIFKGDEVLFSVIESERLSSEIMAYIAGGLLLVAAGFIGFSLYFKRNPKIVENSEMELIFASNYRVDLVSKKRAEPMSHGRRNVFIAVYIAFTLVLGAIAAILLILSEFYPDEVWMAAVGFVFLILMFTLPPFSMSFFFLRYSEKNVPIFVKNYLRFIKHGPKQTNEPSFTKDGFKYDFEEETFPYSECKIYAAVVYEKAFCAANIFIVTEIASQDDFYITQLMPEEYEAIKENNVEVEGLDEALDNLEENIHKYVGKKRIVVMKKDGVEITHIVDRKIAARKY